MNNLTPELIEKAKSSKTAEELLTLAKENGVELTAEEAAAYFAQLAPTSGELSDDELDDVAGGGCSTGGGYTVVSSGLDCFIRDPDGTSGYTSNVTVKNEVVYYKRDTAMRRLWYSYCCDPRGQGGTCGSCYHLEFDGGTGYCGKSKK